MDSFEQMIRNASDSYARINAMFALLDAMEERPSLPLSPALKDQLLAWLLNPDTHEETALYSRQLITLSEGDKGLKEPLLSALKSPNAATRRASLHALMESGYRSTIDAITPLCEDPEVQADAYHALVVLGAPVVPPTPHASHVLEALGRAGRVAPLLDALEDPNSQRSAFQGLRSVRSQADAQQAVPALIALLQDTGVTAVVREDVALTLGWLQDPSAIPVLLDAMGDEELESAALQALVHLCAEEAIPPLFARITNTNRDEYDRADDATHLCGLLAVLGATDAHRDALLAALAEEGVEELQLSVAANIGRAFPNDPTVFTALVALLEVDALRDAALRGLITQSHPKVAEVVRGQLSRSSVASAAARSLGATSWGPALLKRLQDSDDESTLAALSVWGGDAAAAHIATRLLATPKDTALLEAVATFARRGIIPNKLHTQLKARRADARLHSIDACRLDEVLASMEDTDARSRLDALLGDEQLLLSEMAALSLARMGDGDALQLVLTRTLHSRFLDLRLEALLVLALHAQDPSIQPTLQAMTRAPDLVVRDLAVELLTSSGPLHRHA